LTIHVAPMRGAGGQGGSSNGRYVISHPVVTKRQTLPGEGVLPVRRISFSFTLAQGGISFSFTLGDVRRGRAPPSNAPALQCERCQGLARGRRGRGSGPRRAQTTSTATPQDYPRPARGERALRARELPANRRRQDTLRSTLTRQSPASPAQTHSISPSLPHIPPMTGPSLVSPRWAGRCRLTLDSIKTCVESAYGFSA